MQIGAVGRVREAVAGSERRDELVERRRAGRDQLGDRAMKLRLVSSSSASS
jgi:hypothetical protein